MLNINMLPGAASAASALMAEKVRMEVISQNIANAGVTKTPEGGPYQRQVVRFETILSNQFDSGSAVQEVRVAGIEADTRPFRLIYQPGHPDANPKTGMVKFPNVSVHEEMADLIASSRAIEANLAIIRTARQMAMQTLAIGRK
jgi:flagellar basal-body rod protein FlgC